MIFYFPNQVHILKYIKDPNKTLGIKHDNSAYIIAIMNNRESIYLTRMISDKAIGKLHDFKSISTNNNMSFYLHDNIKLSITKEQEKPEFDWMIETIDTYQLLDYPRKKNIGIILPTQKINETYEIIEYSSLLIEPIFDPKNFIINID